MRPEDITGINPEGWRVHVEGCSCDYNELTRRERIADSQPAAYTVIVERLVSRVDPRCVVHRG